MTSPSSTSTNVEAVGPSAGDIQAVHRCARILDLLTEQDMIRPADVATTLDLERSTAHRYLTSMVNARLVERHDGGFRLGPLSRHLGAVSLRRTRVIEEAAPYMAALAEEVGETIVMSLWSGRGAVVAKVQEDPRRQVQVIVREGTQLPLYAAQSQIFFASLPDRVLVDQLLGQLTRPARDTMEASIALFREHGVAENSLVTEGIRTIAVPITADPGDVVATVAVVGTAEAVPSDPQSGKAIALKRTADQISARLSGLPAVAAAPLQQETPA
ncbi:MAG: helix-turn-helix domain-containing protein [Patulibacter sp.]